MKKLIFFLVFGSPSLYASGPEIMERDEGKQIVSIIKDIEVKDMLAKSNEFSSCRDMYQFKADASEDEKNASLQKAEACFKTKMPKDGKKLTQLADSLNLQNYGLIKSKNLKDIQNYLSDKLYESMTGVKREEADKKKLIESMKFGNKKHIDQKTFIEMYKTQLGKNALYEVSRFCFEDLRIKNQTDKTSFAEHWAKYGTSEITIDEITDNGEPKFLGSFSDATSKEKVYQDIFQSIQGASGAKLSEGLLSGFFIFCGQQIVPLCEKFEEVQRKGNSEAISKVDSNGTSRGAAACLTKSRIQAFKRALANADKIIEQFDEMKGDSLNLMIAGLKGEPIDIKIFGDGKDPNEKSIDDLTNHASTDLYQGGLTKDSAFDQKAADCEKNPSLDNCEAFIAQGDDLDKAKHRVELEMSLKREVEMARVRELIQKDRADLEKYLEENGYFKLLEDYKNKKLTEAEIEEKIGQAFEAKKIAILEQINNKLGKRQVAKSETALDQTKVKDVIQDTKEERARLAQVVMFNNIITSHLKLQKEVSPGKYEEVGRNTRAWQQEEDALKDATIDPELFANLKATDDGKGNVTKNSQLGSFKVLDSILGKTTP